MEGTVWAIDPVTKDLVFDEQGMLSVVAGEEASIQGIRQTLGAWKGDFGLVPEHGTDYERILGEPMEEDEVDDVIREAIFQETTLAVAEELSVSQNGRQIKVDFAGVLDDGTAISMEVKTNG